MAVQAPASLDEIHRFTLDEYHQLIESGAFDEDLRVELIDGLIVDRPVASPEHNKVIWWLTRWLAQAIDWDRFQLGVQTDLTIEAAGSEPEPDFAVIPRDAPAPYHPSTAALVIEVAVSSRHRDLQVKPRLYALAGVPEYWVVAVERNQVVVHRQPVGDRYETVIEVGPGATIQATALELPPLPVAELLAAASA